MRQTCSSIAVTPAEDDEELRARAEQLARMLQLPWVSPTGPGAGHADLLLVVAARRLELREAGSARSRPIYVDFVHGRTGFRRKAAGGRDQPLARALGLRRGRPTVVDATAGLGRDAFLIASLGCTVTAFERSPVLAAMLGDGLVRAAAAGERRLDGVLARLTFTKADARETLLGMSDQEAPQIVYIDPMYPSRKGAALGKKELRILRRLVGDDEDAAELLEVARRVAKARVVVKRARSAPPLAPGPAATHMGSRVRYDVYPRGVALL